MTTELGLPGHTPPRRRVQKSVWRQVLGLLREGLTEALLRGEYSSPRVAVFTPGHLLPRQLAGDALWTVTCQGTGMSPARRAPAPGHVGAVVLDGGTVEERMTLLRHVTSTIRPGGTLMVVASVVTVPGSATPAPALGQLIEELTRATGGRLHLDEIRSVRWAAEPLCRGVRLSATLLTRPGDAAQ